LLGNALGSSLADHNTSTRSTQENTLNTAAQAANSGDSGNGLSLNGSGEGLHVPAGGGLTYNPQPVSLGNDELLGQCAAPDGWGSTPSYSDQSHTVGRGDTVESLARRYYGDDWRAGVTAIISANDLSANKLGSPMIYSGDNLNVPDLQRYVDQGASLSDMGRVAGNIIAGNQRGIDSYNAWLDQQAQIAAAANNYTDANGMRVGPTIQRAEAMGLGSGATPAIGVGTAPDTYTTSLDRALGSYEATFAGATRIAAGLGGGLTYLGTLIATGGDTEAAAYVKEQTEQALSYRIRSAGGQEAADTFATALAPAAKWLGNLKQETGDYYYDKSGPVAGALGYTAPDALLSLIPVAPKAFGSLGGAIAENAFTGPIAGSLRAQIGAVGDLTEIVGANSEVRLSATQLRNTPGVATVSSELAPASGSWLEASVPTAIPAQVGDALAGQSFKAFGDLRQAIWEQIGSNSELNSGFSRANLAKMNDGLSPSAPTNYLTESGAFGDSFNIHHAIPIENGGAVYDLSNLRIVSPKIHFDIHYGPN